MSYVRTGWKMEKGIPINIAVYHGTFTGMCPRSYSLQETKPEIDHQSLPLGV